MSNEIYRSRWDTCDDCEVAVIVERSDGVPDIDEWDAFPSCPICGSSLSFGNADEQTIRETALAQGDRRVAAAIARAFEQAADELETHLYSKGTWNSTVYKGSPGWLRDKAAKAQDRAVTR